MITRGAAPGEGGGRRGDAGAQVKQSKEAAQSSTGVTMLPSAILLLQNVVGDYDYEYLSQQPCILHLILSICQCYFRCSLQGLVGPL